MDRSSPAAVRAPLPFSTTNLDRVRKVRLLIEQQEQRKQHAREVSEAYELGRQQAATDHWMAGAKVAFALGLGSGLLVAAAACSILSQLGLLS